MSRNIRLKILETDVIIEKAGLHFNTGCHYCKDGNCTNYLTIKVKFPIQHLKLKSDICDDCVDQLINSKDEWIKNIN